MKKLAEILSNSRKILGLNERFQYVKEYNSQGRTDIANNKILTKQKLEEARIPTPKLISIVKNKRELDALDWNELPKSFVIKPARGKEGKGIEIIFNRKGNYWITSNSQKIDRMYLYSQMITILDGKYSIGNRPDKVIIEERIKPHSTFREYTYKGTPDIRILLFKGVPIMAMLRIPTKASRGRANLMQGAIGVGIDMAAGRLTNALLDKTEIEKIPHTGVRISGKKIPYWNTMLKLAIDVYRATSLGYMSVDFVLDNEKGPLVLEINSNTGLTIQKINQDGIRWRAELVKDLVFKSKNQIVRVAKDLFGGQIEESVENITGRAVIGLKEEIILTYGNINTTATCKINTMTKYSRVHPVVLEEIKMTKELEALDEEIEKLKDAGMSPEKIKDTLNKDLAQNESPLRLEVSTIRKGLIQRFITLNTELEESIQEMTFLISSKITTAYPVEIGRDELHNFIIDSAK